MPDDQARAEEERLLTPMARKLIALVVTAAVTAALDWAAARWTTEETASVLVWTPVGTIAQPVALERKRGILGTVYGERVKPGRGAK